MKDLTVILVDKPGTLADAFEAVGNAGVNMVAACGFPAGGEGVLDERAADPAPLRGRRHRQRADATVSMAAMLEVRRAGLRDGRAERLPHELTALLRPRCREQ